MAVIALVAVVGVVGFVRLGAGMGTAIGGDGQGAAAAHGALSDLAVSRQAGIYDGVERAATSAIKAARREIDFAASLPTRGSVGWDGYVHQLRTAMTAGTGEGYTILRAKQHLPRDVATAFPVAKGKLHELVFNPQKAMNYRIFGESFDAMRNYRAWLDDLVQDAIADNGRRYEQENSFVDLEGLREDGMDGWHIDNRAITFVRTLHGPGTEYALMQPHEFHPGETMQAAAYRFRDALKRGEYLGQGRVKQVEAGDILVVTGRLGGPGPWADHTFRGLPAIVHRPPNTATYRAVLQNRFDIPAPPPGGRPAWL